MKTFKNLKMMSMLFACVLTFGFVSCGDDDDDSKTPLFSVKLPDGSSLPASFDAAIDGESQAFTITSSGTWSVKKEGTSTDWVTVSPEQGSKTGEVTITVANNTEISKREMNLIFLVNSTRVRSYTITQAGNRASIIPSITLSSPEDAASYNLASADINFSWTSKNIVGAYTLLISDKEDLSSVILSKSAAGKSVKVTGSELDARLDVAGVALGAKKTLYWSVNPSDEDEAVEEKVEVRSIEITRNTTKPLYADMLDVQFNLDGTATDLSPMGLTVEKINYTHPFTVANNATYGFNVATFNPEAVGAGSGANKGSYYRINYAGNNAFESKLADGHSFECLVQFDIDFATITGEIKFFSTQEAGGTGFLVAAKSNNNGPNGLTFLPNVSTTGRSTWNWANSKVVPEKNKWYHVVGVWNKETNKAIMYVNGEKLGEADTAGNFNHTSSAATRWVAIGGDAGADQLQNMMKGSVGIARIYDNPLTDAEVTKLWNQVKK